MLKIDLLPAHYAIARRNRKVIFTSIPLLVGVAALWLLVLLNINHTIGKQKAALEEATAAANIVLDIQSKTSAKQAELQPIKDKVDFVQAADKSGGQYWDRFHEINKYIYDKAVVSNFSITPPSSVSFAVQLQTTEDAGRFILNLIRCPYITGISISGTPTQGGAIEGAKGTTATGAGGAGAPGMPGMPGMPGGPAETGMPGMAPGMPGMPPGMGGQPGAAAVAGKAQGPIIFTISATLVQPISIPAPPNAAAASAQGMPAGAGPAGPAMPGAGPMGGAPPAEPGASSAEPPSADAGGGKAGRGANAGGGDEA